MPDLTIHFLGDPDGTCRYWVESRGDRCGRATSIRFCGRHHRVILAAWEKRREAARTELARRDADLAAALPDLRARLARVEAEIRRRDPEPPTTDLAAYGGVGSTTARAYQRRILSNSNVRAMARLVRERDHLIGLVAAAQAAADGVEP